MLSVQGMFCKCRGLAGRVHGFGYMWSVSNHLKYYSVGARANILGIATVTSVTMVTTVTSVTVVSSNYRDKCDSGD